MLVTVRPGHALQCSLITSWLDQSCGDATQLRLICPARTQGGASVFVLGAVYVRPTVCFPSTLTMISFSSDMEPIQQQFSNLHRGRPTTPNKRGAPSPLLTMFTTSRVFFSFFLNYPPFHKIRFTNQVTLSLAAAL